MGTNEYKKEVVIVLLTDEQYVVKWLSQYGALPRAQIIKMLKKPPQTAEKILRNLKRQIGLRRGDNWRRGGDSNPRCGLTHTRFPSVHLKPLGHLSNLGNVVIVRPIIT